MTYDICELLGPDCLLPYEVGIFPKLQWIPWNWLLRCKDQSSCQRFKIYMISNGITDVHKINIPSRSSSEERQFIKWVLCYKLKKGLEDATKIKQN